MRKADLDAESLACAIVARALKHQGTVTIYDDVATLPAWDSLAHMTIVLELETQTGRQLDPEEVAGIASVRAVAELIAR
jgi:acyl carrier protein